MLTRAVETYLAVRRAAGFALRCEGSHLKSFAAFSEVRKQHYVSNEVAIEWAGLAQSMPQRARRLGIVIRLARYLRAEDQRHEVPPAVFGAERLPRSAPYILTAEQIRQLIEAASRTRPRLARATYSTLFSLLACTGLRVSEATRLQLDDITPDGLVIRRTKFRKSRLSAASAAYFRSLLSWSCPSSHGKLFCAVGNVPHQLRHRLRRRWRYLDG
jgi:integrase/recombinase XerD